MKIKNSIHRNNMHKNLASKEDLRKAVENLASKEDLRKAVENLASKEDLRVGLKVQGDSIVEEIAENINNFMQEVEEKKADRKDVEDLEKQMDKLERKIYQ